MTHPMPSSSTAVLADALVPEIRARSAILVVGGALLVAALAQVRIPLGFTPVPITLQTFGVTLVGASLGARRGMLALLLYVFLGALGFPFYAGGEGGWGYVAGSTGGYLFGFVLAAALVGWMTERRADRNPWMAFLAFQAGSLVIFTFGTAGLMLTLDIPLPQALRIGWLPFVPGDLLKTAVAAGLFPASWILAHRFRHSS